MIKNIFITVLTCTALCPLALADPVYYGGVSGSGGGDAYTSTPADVKKAVDGLRNNYFGLISQAQTRQILNPQYVTDPDLKKLLQAFTVSKPTQLDGSSGIELLNDAELTKFVVKNSCIGDGTVKDASTKHRRGAAVCFNDTALARYSPDELEEQVATLGLHELAHHFGADEKVARKFQAYMRDFVRETYEIRRQFPNLESDKVKWTELRPGGIHLVKGNCEDKVVRCSSDGFAAMRDLVGSAAITYIQPGQMIVVSSKSGPHAIRCNKYPTVDCVVRNGMVSVGDYVWPFAKESGKTVDDELRILQQQGICKKSINPTAVPTEKSSTEGVSAE